MPGDGIKRILGNSGWLAADSVLRMLLGVLVGAWVARYLGPTQFGQLAFAIAFVALFQAAGKLGLNQIVVRDIARDEDAAGSILGTALRLRLVAGFVCWAAAIGAMALLRPGDTTALVLVAIVAGTVLFQSAETVDLWFQSQTQSKRTVIAKMAAVLTANLIRVALILLEAPLVAFAAVMLVEWMLIALGLVVAYKRYPAPTDWSWATARVRELLTESWPFLLSGIAIMIYMRIDQIMLRSMIGVHEVGIYSAAVRLSAPWYFIPTAICISAAPAIARKKARSEKEYMAALRKLFSLMWWASLPLCALVALVSGPVIYLLFGSAYAASAAVLAVHIFSNVPVALGVAQTQWIANEQRSRFALYRTLLGCVCNVVLNLILIPAYGAMGAAIATVLSQFIAAVGSNLLLEPRMFVIQMRCLIWYG